MEFTISKRDIRTQHEECLFTLRTAIREGDGDTAKLMVERMAELDRMLDNKLEISGPGYVYRPIASNRYGPNGETIWLDMDDQ